MSGQAGASARAPRPVLEWGVARDNAELAVLAVHGRAQTPAFMRETAQRFGAAPVRFHAPEAVDNSWYPHPFLEPLERNRPELDESLRTIESCLTRLAELGFAPDRVVLWGFSQGACLLSHHVLTRPRPFAGIVLFTGGHLGPDPLPVPAGAPLRNVPVVVRSIDRDPWVPRGRVEDTAAALSASGAVLDLHIEDGDEHIITDEACHAAGRLLVSAAREASTVR